MGILFLGQDTVFFAEKTAKTTIFGVITCMNRVNIVCNL